MEKKELYNDINKNFLRFFLGSLIKRGSFMRALKCLKFLIKQFKKVRVNPLYFIEYIIFIVRPVMNLKDYYMGRTKFRIPYFIYGLTGYKIGMRWLLRNLELRAEKSFFLRMYKELEDSLSNQVNSKSNIKKEQFYKLIIKNRPFLKNVKKKNY